MKINQLEYPLVQIYSFHLRPISSPRNWTRKSNNLLRKNAKWRKSQYKTVRYKNNKKQGLNGPEKELNQFPLCAAH